ncbi:cache domain-containing protein [Paracoccus sp. DMF-8]|uniref:sensor histidine kinase n=1 Tax=Paracoccus sp. DMF-8 TaxID=3019445 RepID=UPI0023E89AF3|nr:cache domain-containing protein [Paracoccus sp. DMF-8]MDF3606480.1 cache domain-containing protein [Paracoccus sp. DMF-8]
MTGTESTPRRSVRARLLMIALLPMLILMPLLIGITMQRWIWRTDQILAARVASDLTVAQQYLMHLIASTDDQLAALAGSVAFRERIESDLAGFLAENRDRLGLDYLLLLADAYQPRHRNGTPALPEETGIVVLEAQTLSQLSPDLPRRALVLLADPRQPARTEARGMVIHASAPVILPDGQRLRLVGGILLNNNTGFVDRINELVYPASANGARGDIARGFDLGVTTLFLDDIRIATTLRPEGGARALGTRASAPVSARVLDQGGSWHDTAMVVNAPYISAYEALTDVSGARVGMLYAGIPKAPYRDARRVTWAISSGAFLIALLLFLPLFLSWARGIFRPLEAMGRTISRVENGDMGARTISGAVVEQRRGADEILRLARHLDRLLDLVQQRDHDLRALNAGLNQRVEERTAELTQANRALAEATRQLVLSEKLATIGEVTAGVAHEINNPLAVIQGNVDVLRLILDEQGCETPAELALIDEQVHRIGALVSQLLQFARPEEFAGATVLNDPSQVAADLRPLIQHLLSGIDYRTDLHSTGLIAMNVHELQQILVNLATNAIQAMPNGGTLILGCKDQTLGERPGIALTLRDNGEGMAPETVAQIFDPFYTTRGRRGTELGLSICQTLVNRHEGQIRAESAPGQGSTFTIWLPAA